MAKTATLNGGATGGLHTTTPILHSSEEEESHPKNPNTQQRTLPKDDNDNDNDASCRGVDSNSSFDSGHEDGGGGGSHNIIARPQSTTSPSDDMSRWSSSCNNNTKHSSSTSIQQYYNKEDKESEGGKKRRKQSRPVRIPASELLDNPQLQQQQQSETGPGPRTTTTNNSTVRMGRSNESSTSRHQRRLSMDNDEDDDNDDDDDAENDNAASDLDDNNDDERVNSPNRDSNNSRNHHHDHQKFVGKIMRKGYQTPLNLSKDPEDDEENIPSHLSTHPNLPFHESLQFQLQQQQQQLQHHLQLQLNSSSTLDNEKTDISGQGTKDSQQQHRSNSNPSFSPGLFPLIGSSPFFSFFPSGQTGQLPASLQQLQNQLQQQQQQQQQQQHHHSSNNPQSGNNSSSSSTGSNQHPNPHHHHHNNNNILGSNSNVNPTSGGLTLQNIPPHRIFNPEAYCDLCNKEFCNKYFLKTHKANKHGVYSENPPTSTINNQGGGISSSGSQNMGGSGSTSLLPPTSQIVMAAAAALSVSSSPSTPFHSTPTAATPANLVCASVPSQHQQQQQQQQQQILHLTSLGLNPSQTAKANSMMVAMMENEAALSLEHKGGGNSNGSQSASTSRESFCDLCQKEFCNKYFLKRHKAKIHGIPMEQSMSSRSSSSGKNTNTTTSQNHQSMSMNQNNLNSNNSNSGGRNNNNTNNNNNNNGNRALNFTNGLTSDNGRLPLMMMGSELESLGLELVAKHIEEEDGDGDGGVEEGEVEHGHGNSTNGPGHLRLMKESNERRDRDRERERDGEQGDDDDNDNDNDNNDDDDGDRPASDDERRSPYNNNSKISSLHQQLNMGMNMKIPLGLPQLNETTCQFCYREFSNKSLLRSHIMKKHRLLLPTFPPFMLPFHSQQQQQQSSTGSSHMYDENQHDSEQGPIGMDYSGIAATAMMMGLGGSAIGNIGQDSEAKDSGGEVDYECTQCGRSFQTIYLLRMHKSYFHPESDDMSDITAAAAAAVTKMEENSDIEESETAPASVLPGQLTDSDNNKIMGGRIPGFKSQCGQDSDRENDQDMEQGDDNDNDNDNNNEDDEEEEEEEEAEANSDSDDLRRLQTMIMELNRVSSANPPASWSPPLDSARSNSQSSHSRSPAIINSSGNNMTPINSTTTTTMSSGMNNSTASICTICSKEFYSAYFLQQHIQQYHGNNNNSTNNNANTTSGDVLKSESPDMQLISNINKKIMSGEPFENNNSISGLHLPHHQQQGKDKDKPGKDSESLSGMESSIGGGMGNPLTSVLGLGLGHPSSFLSPSSSGHKSSSISSSLMTTPGKGDGMNTSCGSGGSNSGKRPSPSLSRSYCTICHKELCNKYFMRTHMLKMHGISIESSIGLGGVTCDICHKELCSKYFLKVHKQNTHGIIDDGPSPPNPSTPGPMGLSLPSSSPSDASRESPSLSTVKATATALASSQGDLVPLLSNNPMDLQSRYFCHYSEVCPFCGRRFRSAKWLKTHLIADHGPDGKERWKAIEKSLQLQQHSLIGSGGPGPGSIITSSSSSSGNHPSISSNRRPPSKLGASSISGERSSSAGGVGTGGSSSSGHHTSSLSGSGLSKSGQKSSSSSLSKPSIGIFSTSNPKSTSNNNGSSSGQLSSSGGGNAGNKCSLCGFTTLDMDTMKVHLIKEHASQLAGADPTEANLNLNLTSYQDSQRGIVLDPLTLLFQKMEGGTNKMYRCAYCPFTTSLLVYLYAHERTHQHQQQSGNSPKTNLNSTTDMQQPGGGTFQCPICFHTFQQLETFQQHLIGHQMSGVLAPFSAPSTSGCLAFLNNNNNNNNNTNSNNPESPTSLEQQQQQQQQALASLSLPLLNGAMPSSGDSLYWALKNSGASLGSSLGLGLGLQGMAGNNSDGGERGDMRGDHGSSPLMLDGKQMIKTESSSSPVNMAMTMSMTGGLNPILPASLTSTEIRGSGSHSGQNQSQNQSQIQNLSQSQRSNSNNNSNNEDEEEEQYDEDEEHASKPVDGRTIGEKTGKRRRRSQSVMDDDDEDENDESVLLISSRVVGKRRKRGKISSFRCSFCQMTFPSRFDCSTHIEQSHSVRRRKKKRSFRCRKCKFTSNRYQKLVIHNRLHHSSTHRGFQMSKDESSRGGSRLMSWNKFRDEGDMRPGTGISNPLPTQSQRRASSWNLESLPQGRAIPIQPAVLGEYMMQGFLLSCSNANDDDDEELSTEEATMKNEKGQQNTLSIAPLPPSTSTTTSVPLDKTSEEGIESENSKGNEDALKNSESDPGSTTNSTGLEGESSIKDESIQNSKMMAMTTVANTTTTATATTTISSSCAATTSSTTGTIATSSPSNQNQNQRNICANLNSTQELFVPSLVYLPVREKVSHSLRVSFSLTPTS